MIYRLLLLLPLLLFSLSSVEAQNYNRFSSKVDMKKFTKEYWKIDKNKADMEISKANILKLIKKYSDRYNVDLNASDTIFILETCSVESMICYGSLWSKKERVDFEFHKKLKFNFHNFFEEKEIEALFKWDKNIFKTLDEEGRSWLPSNIRNATRIIICNGMIKIDRVKYLH